MRKLAGRLLVATHQQLGGTERTRIVLKPSTLKVGRQIGRRDIDTNDELRKEVAQRRAVLAVREASKRLGRDAKTRWRRGILRGAGGEHAEAREEEKQARHGGSVVGFGG